MARNPVAAVLDIEDGFDRAHRMAAATASLLTAVPDGSVNSLREGTLQGAAEHLLAELEAMDRHFRALMDMHKQSPGGVR